MKYSLNFGIWNSVFAVPTEIVDKHIKMCGAANLKVLLVLLRGAGSEMELADIASALNLTTGDAQDALNYWVESGILCAAVGATGTELSAGFLPAPATPIVPAAPAAPVFVAPALPVEPAAIPKYTVGSAPLQKPKPAEIQQMLQKSAELKCLLSEAESALGKTLNSSDISTLAALHDWAGVPVDVLLTVIEYCKIIGKTNLRYIEKVAVGWQERGIDTFEKAERYIRDTLETDAQTKLVKSAFGIYDRALTGKEAEFIRTWFSAYHFDIPVIKLAYERAIERTGKLSFPYINKILTNWHEKNISTPEQAAREEEAFSRQKTDQSKAKSSYDIDELEQYLLHSSPK